MQDALTALRGGPGAVAGYKLAFNGQGSRNYYGLAEGCIAPLFRHDIRPDDAVLRLADFHSLVIEPEICLELGRDLPHPAGLTPAEALATLSAIRPAVDVMDPRGAFALDPSAAQAVAQGIYTAGAVLGAPIPAARLADRHGVTTRLVIGGACVGERLDGTPQDPLEGLIWAGGALAARGQSLTAGMILLCGTHLPGHPITAPAAVRVAMGDFGTVGFSVV